MISGNRLGPDKMLRTLLPNVCFLLLLPSVEQTVLDGSYHGTGTGVIQYLTKFGVKEGSKVHLSGTISGANNSSAAVLCAFVPQMLWDQLFHNLTQCDSLAFVLSSYLDNSCKTKDSCFVKSVGAENTSFYPFLTSPYKTIYWHLIFIACHTNSSTLAASNDATFTYSIRLENDLSTVFYKQFSYDLMGIVIITMCSTGVASILFLFHVAVHLPLFKCWKPPSTKMHLLVRVYTLSPFLLIASQALQFAHWMIFATDGVGVPSLDHLGFALGGLSTWILVLVFVLLGKGWQMTTRVIRRMLLTLLVWGLYIIVSITLFVWSVVSEVVFPYMASPLHPYNSYEGWVYLSYRVLLLLYLLYELWHSYQQENNPIVMNVYRFFAVWFVVWFGYLPLTVALLYAVNLLEWTRVILSTSLFFDLAANFILIILFCPFWSDYYFQFNSHLNIIDRHTRYTILSLSEKSVAL